MADKAVRPPTVHPMYCYELFTSSVSACTPFNVVVGEGMNVNGFPVN
jgi:hypothetical protein